jgi:signal transduction histidine kinase
VPRLAEELYFAGHKPFDFQVERLIALLRIALTTFSVAAFFVDPARGGRNASAILFVLAAYAAFGVFVALIPIIGRARTGWQLPIHLVDIGMISLLMYFLETISSQFFVLYTFLLLGATVRWNWRGAVLTTVTLLILELILIGLPHAIASLTHDTSTNLLNGLIQTTFLLVVGGMFAFFGASRERSQQRLFELAAWPAAAAAGKGNISAFPIDAALAHVANVLQVPRVLVLWGLPEEPFVDFALWTAAGCRHDRRAAGSFGDWTAPELANVTFATTDARSRACITPRGTQVCETPVLAPALQPAFQINSVTSAAIVGASCTGRVFMLDKPDWSEDDLTLTEIVASRLAIEIDHYALRAELAESVSAMERVRVARDLHDGILQGLTAAGLQLKALAHRVGDGTKDVLENVLQLLLDEQQRIRHFIQERPPANDRPLALNRKLQQLADQNRRQWGCDIPLVVGPDDMTIRPALAGQLEFILAEAVANAVRHGHASRVEVGVETARDRVLISIKDNGQGLKEVTGVYDAAELAAGKIGPVSLRTRIAELNGSLALSSSAEGVELRIGLPV